MVAARVTCAFRLGSHAFPEQITTRIVFCIRHGLLPVPVCDNLVWQTVPETLRTRSSAANRLRYAVYHRWFRYDWRMLSDVDRTHSFSWTVCGAIARLKQKYPILNRHAKSKFATIFNWINSVHRKNIHQISQQLQLNIWLLNSIYLSTHICITYLIIA